MSLSCQPPQLPPQHQTPVARSEHNFRRRSTNSQESCCKLSTKGRQDYRVDRTTHHSGRMSHFHSSDTHSSRTNISAREQNDIKIRKQHLQKQIRSLEAKQSQLKQSQLKQSHNAGHLSKVNHQIETLKSKLMSIS